MTILFPGVQESSVPSTIVKAGAVPNGTLQNIATTSITQLSGSVLKVPNGGLNIGSGFDFEVELNKTAAGTAAATVAVLAGPAGDVTDTVIATFAKPAGDASLDAGVLKVKGTFGGLGTSQVPSLTQASLSLIHNLSTGGIVAQPNVVINKLTTGQVATLAAANFVSLAVTLGASDNYTIDQVAASLTGLTTGAPNE